MAQPRKRSYEHAGRESRTVVTTEGRESSQTAASGSQITLTINNGGQPVTLNVWLDSLLAKEEEDDAAQFLANVFGSNGDWLNFMNMSNHTNIKNRKTGRASEYTHMWDYHVGIPCRNSMLEYHDGISCWKTMVEYHLGISCWNTMLECNVEIPC